MDEFKLTSWNIEWADKLIDALASNDGTKRAKAERRRDAIRAQIAGMAPDILFVSEGPKGEARAEAFFVDVAPGYRLIKRDDPVGKSYVTQGRQWCWFLIRAAAPITGRLLHIDRWRASTRETSFDAHGPKWKVGLPRFVAGQGALLFEAEVDHSHYRHPQVLLAEIAGKPFEVIGGHIKSKHIGISTPQGVGQPGFFKNHPQFTAEVIEARVKISSECNNLRYYMDHRFTEDSNAAIIACGDFNDGPGKEMVEEQFLLHDLIGNLQGEVFFARRFLNHALFDFEDTERWTVQFTDVLDPRRPREILLDHILFSQSFVGDDRPGAFAYRAKANSGCVEHAAHHAANAGVPSASTTSDHRPVSMTFTKRPAGPPNP